MPFPEVVLVVRECGFKSCPWQLFFRWSLKTKMLVYLVHVVPTVWLQYPGGFMFHVPSVQSIRMAQDCIQRHIEKMAAA